MKAEERRLLGEKDGLWAPTTVRRVYRAIGTSTSPLHVLTDVGPAYVKTLGNPEGPHALACDLVGTLLAGWLGLPVFDVALLEFPSGLEVRFRDGGIALPGPAFAAREEEGRIWSGESSDLLFVENRNAISGLVVFDTWVRNKDRAFDRGDERRRNFGNVFLSAEGAPVGRYRLLAIDHTHCFGRSGELSERLSRIDTVRDAAIYGLFEDFRPLILRKSVEDFAARLRTFNRETGAQFIAKIPPQWDVSEGKRNALASFIYERARFVGSEIESWLAPQLGWRNS